MAETYCNSYYAATRNPIAPFSRLDKRIEVDVAIIGGGFTGVATAVELAERGVSSRCWKPMSSAGAHRAEWRADYRITLR